MAKKYPEAEEEKLHFLTVSTGIEKANVARTKMRKPRIVKTPIIKMREHIRGSSCQKLDR